MSNNEQIYFDVLRHIARGYDSSRRIMHNSDKNYGLSPIEALEMAYDNIQAEAERAIKGKRRPAPSAPDREEK